MTKAILKSAATPVLLYVKCFEAYCRLLRAYVGYLRKEGFA
jgi:hypothetical protein